MDNHHNPKIHLNIFSSSQSNSSCPASSFDTIALMFMHSVPLQSPQEATHFSPFAWQEHLEFSPHGFLDQILQLHLITFKMSLVTGSSSLIIGTNLLFSSFQPQYSVFRTSEFKLFRSWSWRYTCKEWKWAALFVGGSASGFILVEFAYIVIICSIADQLGHRMPFYHTEWQTT